MSATNDEAAMTTRISEDEMWMRLRDVPREYPPLEYQPVRRAAVDQKIRAEQRGAAWWVWRPDVELMAAKVKAVRDGVVTSDELTGLDGLSERLAPTVRRIHLLGVQREVELRALEGDAAEAQAAGDLTAADTIRATVAGLRGARYSWNGTTWDFTIPGIGTITSKNPAATAKAGA